MVALGDFFFKYRNMLFPVFGLSIFIPSRPLFTESVFGAHYFWIPFWLGLALAIGGQLIRALTIGMKYIKRGGRNKKVYADKLVTDGMFHHCRNPLYVGNISMLAGVGILSNSLLFVAVVVPLFCFIYQCIVLAEENFLRKEFGAAYDAYANDVNRWWISLKGLGDTLRSMKFNWRRYVLNEYNTVYMLMLSICLVLFVYFPPLASQPSDSKIKLAVVAVGAITAVYLFVRFLKKTGRIDRALAADM